MSTFTPRQLFRFAARMRTNLNPQEVEARVDSVIERLGLENCQNTIFGGPLMRGLSGGEKKRTSIGYELITNPKLIILDEPTSAVDSYTALTILELLKKEAQMGATVVFTIHQPSSDMVNLFDRIICMSDGYMIYNGERKHIAAHFNTLGVTLPRFTNPADFLIRLSIFPEQFRKDLSLEELHIASQNAYKVPNE